MTNSSINKVHVRAHGAIIDGLWDDLQANGFSGKRSPRYFSQHAVEYVDLAVQLSTPVLATLAAIIVARLGRSKRVKVTFNDGPVREIEAPSAEELMKILDQIKEMEIER